MHYLKITDVSGTFELIEAVNVLSILCAADTLTNGVFVKGRITGVSYIDKTNTLATVTAIPAYNGANTRYELGCLLQDGMFQSYRSN